MRNRFVIDYGAVNLKSLVVTNDADYYEKMKAQDNIGVLFEPKVIGDVELGETAKIYAVGILADT
ncbi:hypothetical protein NDK47_24310 [Brevibacillus ruminantium]|uniref:Uncharacterized protein n=1 Tax=Brevibacillus ruminantium TaxID=2950604 RepID=A0ABY4WDE4_9BACL|nr:MULTISPECIES: hypothetical protein [Brevibacillus]USG65210.1 hypothetical protein NDK47_24310 [Brevibacillus ruminantium]WNF07217.1 hypothetical protein RFB14_07260 [Brevibacillus borstelensis]